MVMKAYALVRSIRVVVRQEQVTILDIVHQVTIHLRANRVRIVALLLTTL